MTEMFRVRPMRVNKAEEALINAIRHFVVLDFNFNNDVAECVTNLFLGLELLLKELVIQQGHYRDEMYLPTMEILIDEYRKWDEDQKRTIHWLRRKRNKITHSGGAYWGEVSRVKQTIAEVFTLAGSLYRELDYDIDDIFTKFEAGVLIGVLPTWRDHCGFLGKIIKSYIDIDTETALQLANKAYEISFRGYAKSWDIENADTAPIVELYKYLEELEITTDREFVCIEGFTPYPHYLYQAEEGDEECNPLKVFFLDNVRLSDMNYTGFTQHHGSDYVVRKYIDHIYDAVTSNIKRAVNLPYVNCFLDKFPIIMDELHYQFPDLIIPRLQEELGIHLWNYEEFWIMINFDERSDEIGWNDNHDEAFKAITTRFCGPLPDFVNIRVECLGDYRFVNKPKSSV